MGLLCLLAICQSYNHCQCHHSCSDVLQNLSRYDMLMKDQIVKKRKKEEEGEERKKRKQKKAALPALNNAEYTKYVNGVPSALRRIEWREEDRVPPRTNWSIQKPSKVSNLSYLSNTKGSEIQNPGLFFLDVPF